MQATYYHIHLIDEETTEHQNGRREGARTASTCLRESGALDCWHHQTPYLWGQMTCTLLLAEWEKLGWVSPLTFVRRFFYFTSHPLIAYPLGCQKVKQNGKQLN